MIARVRNACAFVMLTGALCATAGCQHPAGGEILEQAYQLGEQYRWSDAKPLVRAYLLDHPDDAAAHYLWGRCYLHNSTPYLALAEGEFKTALNLFRRNNDLGILAAHFNPAQFEAALHRETARVYMRWVHEAAQQGLPAAFIRTQLKRALDEVRQGRALDPDSTVLKEMEQTLEEYFAPLPIPRRKPESTAPTHELTV